MQRIFGSRETGPVRNFMNNGVDFIVEKNLGDLVAAMNVLAKERGGPTLNVDEIKKTIDLRDAQITNKYSKDAQIMLMDNARRYWPDKWLRVAKPHKILDPAHGPLIAVQMNLLTRKTLGGIETDLQANVVHPDGSRFPNLYAAGEVSGFGGGGVHGYNSLEGTFLGGCIFSGRVAGRAIADLVSTDDYRARI